MPPQDAGQHHGDQLGVANSRPIRLRGQTVVYKGTRELSESVCLTSLTSPLVLYAGLDGFANIQSVVMCDTGWNMVTYG
jgi:hypothetical protein